MLFCSLFVDGGEKCTSEQFQCGEGGKCVPKRWVCDYHKDCDGGEDEYDCRKCFFPIFECGNLLTIVPLSP